MNRTYSDLKRGGVLAVGDTLLLHGYQQITGSTILVMLIPRSLKNLIGTDMIGQKRSAQHVMGISLNLEVFKNLPNL